MISTRYNGAFTCSILAIAVAAIALAMTLPTLLTAVVAGAGEDADASKTRSSLLARHEIAQTEDRERFLGRSAFFTPPKRVTAPVRRTPRATPKPTKIEPRPDPGPRVETKYTGPAITAIVIDTVWFDDGKQIAVETETDGIRVIDIKKSPYSARLSYKGWEGEVPLFDKPITLTSGTNVNGTLGGIIDSESGDERAARIDAINRSEANESAPATARPAASRRNEARNRGLSEAQRRRARESDPNKPSVPDESAP